MSYFHVCSDRFVFFTVEQPTTETGRGIRAVEGIVKAYGSCEWVIVRSCWCVFYVLFLRTSVRPSHPALVSFSLSFLPHHGCPCDCISWCSSPCRNDARQKGRTTSPIRRWLYGQRKSRRTVHECASLQVGKASITNVAQGDHGFWWWRWWWWCWVNVQGGKKRNKNGH